VLNLCVEATGDGGVDRLRGREYGDVGLGAWWQANPVDAVFRLEVVRCVVVPVDVYGPVADAVKANALRAGGWVCHENATFRGRVVELTDLGFPAVQLVLLFAR